MTLSAFAWNLARTHTLTLGRRYLVMYVSAADNDYVGVTGTFLGTASQGVWSTARLDFSAPPGAPFNRSEKRLKTLHACRHQVGRFLDSQTRISRALRAIYSQRNEQKQ